LRGAGHELSEWTRESPGGLLRAGGTPQQAHADPRGRFEALFRQNADTVLAYATRRSDPDTAQEVVAETFAVAWRRLDVVPDPAIAWLLGVARKVLANERRSRSRADALTLRLVRGSGASSEDTADMVDARLSVQAALDGLPPADREVLELLAWEGLSADQAADVLGCSRATIAVRFHRARRRFHRLLEAPLEAEASSSASPEISSKRSDRITRTTRMEEAHDARYPTAP
jgi:RNA polymerase sigma-70 factor (ECF subfamily)